MLRPTEERAEQARKKAQQVFTRDRAKETEVVKEREREFAATTRKTARLKALRLARDAETQAAESAAKKPAKKRGGPKAAG